jgi:hypothetical protein
MKTRKHDTIAMRIERAHAAAHEAMMLIFPMAGMASVSKRLAALANPDEPAMHAATQVRLERASELSCLLLDEIEALARAAGIEISSRAPAARSPRRGRRS